MLEHVDQIGRILIEWLGVPYAIYRLCKIEKHLRKPRN